MQKMADQKLRDASTSYAVGGSNATRRGIFTDYFVPGGGKIRAIDSAVFLGATKKSGDLIKSLFDSSDLYRAINNDFRREKLNGE